jgi:hypothetical protein
VSEARRTGAALSTDRVNGCDVPPPGAGFSTVTPKKPADVTSDDGIAAESEEELRYVVVSGVDPHLTTAPSTKFVPSTEIVVGGDDRGNDAGLSDVGFGTGLTMLIGTELLVPPPGVWLKTLKDRIPVDAVNEALTETVRVLGVELRTEIPAVLPSHRTTDELLKPEPSKVISGVVPRITAVGIAVESVGTVLLTVKNRLFETPPPGVGFETEIAGNPTLPSNEDGRTAVKVVELT